MIIERVECNARICLEIMKSSQLIHLAFDTHSEICLASRETEGGKQEQNKFIMHTIIQA